MRASTAASASVPVGRERDFVAVQLQRALERFAHGTVVVDYEYEHFGSKCASGRETP